MDIGSILTWILVGGVAGFLADLVTRAFAWVCWVKSSLVYWVVSSGAGSSACWASPSEAPSSPIF